ncbi:MAG: hypothetical protein N2234_08425 [Planctomycetota bacterium]|nr:hypothetical protein [Planctomycetota bacterium]
MAEKESYIQSLRAAVVENNIEVAQLKRLQELVYERRRRLGLLRADDNEKMSGGKGSLRWQHRVRSALLAMCKTGECVLIGRALYRFFI